MQIRTITVGDTLTPMGFQLLQQTGPKTFAPADLAGKTLKFKLVADNGTVVVAEVEAGLTVVDVDLATVQYDFAEADVDTPGIYFAWVLVYDGTEKDTYPSDGRELKLILKAAA